MYKALHKDKIQNHIKIVFNEMKKFRDIDDVKKHSNLIRSLDILVFLNNDNDVLTYEYITKEIENELNNVIKLAENHINGNDINRTSSYKKWITAYRDLKEIRNKIYNIVNFNRFP